MTTTASVIRRVLLAAALAAVAIVVVPAQQRPATPPPEARPLRLLFLGHDRDHHPSGKLLPLIAAPLARRGIQMTHVSTPEEALVPATLKHYDGLVLYANHETITPEQEQALVDFVEGGKAMVVIHCASFMFTKAPRYIPMVGGQFLRHGTGEFTAEIIAPDHPVMKGLKPFTTWDETYVHTRHNTVDRTVLMERVDSEGPRAVHVGADAGQGPRLLHRVRPRRADLGQSGLPAADRAGHRVGRRRERARRLAAAEDARGRVRRGLQRPQLREARSGAEVPAADDGGRLAEVHPDAGRVQGRAVRAGADARRQADHVLVRRARPPVGDRGRRLSQSRAARRPRATTASGSSRTPTATARRTRPRSSPIT